MCRVKYLVFPHDGNLQIPGFRWPYETIGKPKPYFPTQIIHMLGLLTPKPQISFPKRAWLPVTACQVPIWTKQASSCANRRH